MDWSNEDLSWYILQFMQYLHFILSYKPSLIKGKRNSDLIQTYVFGS